MLTRITCLIDLADGLWQRAAGKTISKYDVLAERITQRFDGPKNNATFVFLYKPPVNIIVSQCHGTIKSIPTDQLVPTTPARAHIYNTFRIHMQMSTYLSTCSISRTCKQPQVRLISPARAPNIIRPGHIFSLFPRHWIVFIQLPRTNISSTCPHPYHWFTSLACVHIISTCHVPASMSRRMR